MLFLLAACFVQSSSVTGTHFSMAWTCLCCFSFSPCTDLGCRKCTEQKGPSHMLTLSYFPSSVEEQDMGGSYHTQTHRAAALLEQSFSSNWHSPESRHTSRQASCFHIIFLFISSFFMSFRGKKKPSVFPQRRRFNSCGWCKSCLESFLCSFSCPGFQEGESRKNQ